MRRSILAAAVAVIAMVAVEERANAQAPLVPTVGRSRRLGAATGAIWGTGVGAALGATTALQSNGNNNYRDPECEPDVENCARQSDFERRSAVPRSAPAWAPSSARSAGSVFRTQRGSPPALA